MVLFVSGGCGDGEGCESWVVGVSSWSGGTRCVVCIWMGCGSGINKGDEGVDCCGRGGQGQGSSNFNFGLG